MADQITNLIARPPNAAAFLQKGIGGLLDPFIEGQQLAGRRNALADLPRAPDGSIDFNTAVARLLQAGDMKGAQALAQISNAQQAHSGVYGTPIYGTLPDGSTGLGVIDKRGQFRPVNTPGFKPAPGVRTIDTGTGTMLLDSRTGVPIGGAVQPGATGAPTNTRAGFVPKDVAGEAALRARGKVAGETQAMLPRDILTAQQTVKEVDKLLNHEGLNEVFGPLDQYRPPVLMSDKGRDALARFNQLKGRAFLQAYSILKGGGQITEIEGIKAEAAIARMDRSQSEEDFKQALKDFRDAVEEGVKKLRQMASGAPTAPTASPGAAAPAAAPATPQAGGAAPVQVRTRAERDALPPGTLYLSPEGTLKVKQ